MRETQTRHAARDGVELFVHSWLPEGDIKGVVQIVHGLAEHSARYRRLAQSLTGAGYAVYAHDQRGHGWTAAPDSLGHFANEHGWDLLLSDVLELNGVIRRAHAAPLALLGHSMGSYVTQHYIGLHGKTVDAAILSASAADTGPLRLAALAIAQEERLRLGSRRPSALLTKMTFGDFNKAFSPVRTDFDWLSRDPAEVDVYVADPHCGFESSTQTWVDFLTGLGRLQQSSLRTQVPRNLPIYLLAGDLDPACRQGQGLRDLAEAYLRAGLRDVSLRLYEDGRHEMFNETNRDVVTADLIGWLDTHLARRHH